MKLRVARHTADLAPLIFFYGDILGLDILGHFESHEGYDGVFMGLKGAGWHLEFTTSAQAPEHQPDEDDLLVFYQQTHEEYNALRQKLVLNNINPIPAKNPYWNENGTSYTDPDGYNIIIAVAGIY